MLHGHSYPWLFCRQNFIRYDLIIKIRIYYLLKILHGFISSFKRSRWFASDVSFLEFNIYTRFLYALLAYDDFILVIVVCIICIHCICDSFCMVQLWKLKWYIFHGLSLKYPSPGVLISCGVIITPYLGYKANWYNFFPCAII